MSSEALVDLELLLKDLCAFLDPSIEKLKSSQPTLDFKALVLDIATIATTEVADEDFDYCCSLIFHNDFGLLQFLIYNTQNTDTISAKVEALLFLKQLINDYNAKLQKYSSNIYNVCIRSFSSDSSNKVKNVATEVLFALFSQGLSQNLNHTEVTQCFERFFNTFLSMQTKLSSTVKASILRFLGAIVKFHPGLSEIEQYQAQLLRIFVRTAENSLFQLKKTDPLLATGALSGLSLYLEVRNELDPDFRKEIYKCVLHIINPPEDITRYGLPKCGLSIIIQNCELFNDMVLKTFEVVDQRLESLRKLGNRELKYLSIRATETFFSVLANSILMETNESLAKNCLKYFISKFSNIIHAANETEENLAIAIRGFGFFSFPLSRYSPMAIRDIYFEVIKKSRHLITEETLDNESFRMYSPVIAAIGQILLILERELISDELLQTLIQLITKVLSVYPRMLGGQKMENAGAMQYLFWVIYKKGGCMEKFWGKIAFYLLVVSTSSHPENLIELEQSKDEENFVPSYLDYFQLWKDIFSHSFMLNYSEKYKYSVDANEAEEFLQQMFNILIINWMKLWNSLNLSFRSDKNTEADIFSLDELQPNVPKDFQIFIQSTILFEKLFENKRMQIMMKPWINFVGTQIISLSNKNPIISGFYTAFSVLLNIASALNYFQAEKRENENDLFRLFYQFIQVVSVRYESFSDELYSSCLMLLLSAPEDFISEKLRLHSLTMSFEYGLVYQPLCLSAMSCLERNYPSIRNAVVSSLATAEFERLLCTLNKYLSPKDSKSKLPVGNTVKLRVKIKEDLNIFEDVQNRIQRFLGSLGGLNKAILHSKDFEDGLLYSELSWYTNKQLKVKIPMENLRVEVMLDSLIPKISALLLHSSSRERKIAGGELLHSLILFIVGSNAHRPATRGRGKNSKVQEDSFPFLKLMKHLFPIIIKLAVDIDLVTRKLFGTLWDQLIHWFSNNSIEENPETMALLNACFEATCQDEDSPLRELGTRSVKEFLVWSIKQTSDTEKILNFKSIIRRLYVNLRHHNNSKKLGACMILNQIYRVFRENMALVDEYSFEMLQNLLTCLRFCKMEKDDVVLVAIEKAIANMKKIIMEYGQLFLQEKVLRRMFPGSNSTNLLGLCEWIFLLANHRQKTVRRICFSLLSDLLPILEKSTRFLDSWTLLELIDHFKFSAQFQPNILDCLNAFEISIDGYNFLITQLSGDHKVILEILISDKSMLLANLSKFFNEYLPDIPEKSAIKDLLTSTITIFYLLLSSEKLKISLMESVISCRSYCNFLSIMKAPGLYGFIHIEEKEEFTNECAKLLSQLLSKENRIEFFSEIGKFIESLLFEISSTDISKYEELQESCLIDLLQSLKISEKCLHYGIFSLIFGENSSFLDKFFSKVYSLWDSLKLMNHPKISEICNILLDILAEKNRSCKLLFESLLFLRNDQNANYLDFYDKYNEKINLLISLNFEVFSSTISKNNKIAEASNIFNTLLNWNISSIDQDSKVARIFLKKIGNEDEILRKIMLHLYENHNHEACLGLIKNIFQAFERSGEPISKSLLEMFGGVYLNLVSKNQQIDFQTEALMVATYFLRRDTSANEIELHIMNFIGTRIPISPSEYPENSSQRREYLRFLEQLLAVFLQTDAQFLLAALASVILKEENHPFTNQLNEGMEQYVSNSPKEKVTICLDFCFKEFSSINYLPPVYRCNIGYLLTTLLASTKCEDALETFFVEKISSIMKLAKEPLSLRKSDVDLKNELLAKAIAFELIRILYIQFPANFLNSMDSKINTAFAIHPKSGKELTQEVVKLCHEQKCDKTTLDSPSIHSYFIKCKQSAYNALCAAILCTQSKENFFTVFLFKENESKRETFWENIVNLNESIFFDVVLEKPMLKLRINGLREKLQKSRLRPSALYLSSQFFSDSSLSKSLYSFSDPLISTQEKSNQETSKSDDFDIPIQSFQQLDIEADIVNRNPVMPWMIKVVNFLHSNITPPSADVVNSKPPTWVMALLSKFTGDVHINIKIFIAKLIINCEHVFLPYATLWYRPFLSFILKSEDFGSGFNYFLQDLCIAILTWSETVKLEPTYEDKLLAYNVINCLISRISSQSNSLLRNNLEIIKMMVESWKPIIVVPTKSIYDLLITHRIGDDKSSLCGIQVCGIFLVNELEPFYSGKEVSLGSLNESLFYESLVGLFGAKSKKLYSSAAEVVGMLLLLKRNKKEDFLKSLEKLVLDKINSFNPLNMNSKEKNYERYVNIIHGIISRDSSLFAAISSNIFYLLPSLVGPLRFKSFEIIKFGCTQESETFSHLYSKNILGIIKQRSPNTQKVIIEILRDVYKSAPLSNLEKLFDVIIEVFPNHSVLECRLEYYKFLMALVKDSNLPTSLIKKIKINLLSGFRDNSPIIREILQVFWNDSTSLPSSPTERLDTLLSDLYDENVEDIFLNYSSVFLLDLTKSSYEFDMEIFPSPLPNAKFDSQYEDIDLSEKTLSTLSPLFMTSQTNLIPKKTVPSGDASLIKATPTTMLFSLTPSIEFENMEEDQTDIISQPSISFDRESKYNSFRRRFYKQPKDQYYFKKKAEIKKKRLLSQINQQSLENIKVFRNYRKGDLPDIQIKYSDIIKPLQYLCMLDNEIAKEVFVILTEYFANDFAQECKQEDFKKIIGRNISQVFCHVKGSSSPFVNAMLQLCTLMKEVEVSPSVIYQVAYSSGNIALGIVFVEMLLSTSDCNTGKKIRKIGSQSLGKNKECWISLAKFYESIQDYEHYSSIYVNFISSESLVKSALRLEEKGEYHNALEDYKKIMGKYQTELNEESNLVEDRLMKCLLNLGEWDDLIGINSKHLNTLLESESHLLKDKIDIMLQSYVRLKYSSEFGGTSKWSGETLSILEKQYSMCRENSRINQFLEENFALDLINVEILCGNYLKVKQQLINYMKSFPQKWGSLPSLALKVKESYLRNLQLMLEKEEAIDIVNENSANEHKFMDLMEVWVYRHPQIREDDMQYWEKILFNRLLLCDAVGVKNKLISDENEETYQNCVVSYLSDSINGALIQNQPSTARRFFEKLFLNFPLAPQNHLLNLKIRHEESKQLSSPLQAVITLQSLVQSVEPTSNEVKLLVSSLCHTGRLICNENTPILNVESYIDWLPKENGTEKLLEWFDAQGEKIILSFQGEKTAKEFLNFAYYFDGYLKIADEKLFSNRKRELQYANMVVRNVFNGLKLDCSLAKEFLVRVLRLCEIYPEIRNTFKDECCTIPTWVYLPWLNQLVVHLGTDLRNSVYPIISKVGKEYPNSLYFPLRISAEQFVKSALYHISDVKENMDALFALCRSPILDKFVNELQRLHHPDLMLQDWMELCSTKLKNDEKLSASNDFQEIKKFLLDWKNPEFGEYGSDGEKLEKMDIKSFNAVVKYIKEKVYGKYNDYGTVLLSTFSPWLADFIDQDHPEIEIPGQYFENKRPDPEKHIKITSFDMKLLVLSSLRKPKRLTLIGSDGLEYPFLVKGGEDLRLDQRVQQAFNVMNNILSADSKCTQLGLKMVTYKVLPLTSNLGFVEWVKGTKTIKDCIEKDPTSKEGWKKASDNHQKWVYSYGRSGYPDMFSKATRDDTIKEMDTLYTFLQPNAFYSYVYGLCSSVEGFLIIRQKISRNLATINIFSYILGIGDRHLDNLLLNHKSGNVISIDFGHAFGSATEVLPVPELVPFRLTRQIQNLFGPVGSKFIDQYMIYILGALQREREIILNVLDIFIKEPLLDWLKYAVKQAKGQRVTEQSQEEEYSNSQQLVPSWYPKQKLDIVKWKLLKHNPSTITSKELEYGHSSKPYFRSVEKAVKGECQNNYRAQCGDVCSSIEEQVECLIDQATDPNLLARSWVGWAPWV